MQLSLVNKYPFLDIQAFEQEGGVVLSLLRLDLLEEYGESPDHQRRADCFLTEQERQKFFSFNLLKRRHEWLGGRLAAKQAALKMLGAAPDGWLEIEIVNDAQGKPFLAKAGQALACPHISISHSHGLAVAVAAMHPCGIDVQRIVPGILKIRDRFADQAELALLSSATCTQGLGEMAQLTLLWAAKEAVRKMITAEPLLWFTELQVAGVKNLPGDNLLLQLDIRSGRELHGLGDGLRFEVRARIDEEYVLAFSVFTR